MATSSTSSEEESSAENSSTKTENEHWALLHFEFTAECGTTDLLSWRIQHSSGCKASWVADEHKDRKEVPKGSIVLMTIRTGPTRTSH